MQKATIFSVILLCGLMASISQPLAQESADPVSDGILPPAPAQPTPLVEEAEIAPLSASLNLEARLSAEAPALQTGVNWRIFSPERGPDGTMPLVTSRNGGSTSFELPSADYLVHASFGRASVVRRISLGKESKFEVFVLNAGGIELSANMNDQPLVTDQLSFEIYSSARDESGNRTLITRGIRPGQLVRLNQGRYHVVSRYGSINAIVRADLTVEAGKLTKATMEQRGAKIDVKLTAYGGNEAIANTAWSVQTLSGEEVFSSLEVNPSFILGAGEYVIVAQNSGGLTTKEIKVEAGKDRSISLYLAQ